MVDRNNHGQCGGKEIRIKFKLPVKKDRKRHILDMLGIMGMLAILLLPAGNVLASKQLPPPDPNIPIAQEISPALGLWRNDIPVLELSPDGKVMACSQMRFTGETFIFENFDYSKPMIISIGDLDDPISMSFVPNRPELIMESQPAFASNCMHLWDTQTWKRISKMKGFANIMCLPDGKGIMAVCGQELVRINADDKSLVWSIPLPAKAKLTAMAISPDSKKIAIAYQQSVQEISLQDGQKISRSESLSANCLSYSVDNLQYTSDSANLLVGIVALLEKDKFFKSGKRSNRLLMLETGKSSVVQDLDSSEKFLLSPDGELLASLKSGYLMIFSFPSLKPLLRIPFSGTLYGLVWTPDNKNLLTVGNVAVCSKEHKIVHYPPSGLASIGAIFSKKKGRSSVFLESVLLPKCPLFVRRWQIFGDPSASVPADDVEDDQEAAPEEPKTDSTVSPKPIVDSDWYIDQGDREAEAGNAKAALENYQKALALAPGNLVVKEKCNDMQKKMGAGKGDERFRMYLKKAGTYYEKNNIKLAFLYLIEGLRIFPEGSAEAQDLLTMMARKNPDEIKAVLIEKSKELKDIRKLLDAMLQKAAETTPTPI